jgi:hypothetical protein
VDTLIFLAVALLTFFMTTVRTPFF